MMLSQTVSISRLMAGLKLPAFFRASSSKDGDASCLGAPLERDVAAISSVTLAHVAHETLGCCGLTIIREPMRRGGDDVVMIQILARTRELLWTQT